VPDNCAAAAIGAQGPARGEPAPPTREQEREAMPPVQSALRFSAPFRGAEIVLHAVPMGRDLAVTLAGGDVAHIGAVAVAQPRPSLDDAGKTSATTSVIAILGHKEDMLARSLAARIAAEIDGVVTLACGIHYDALAADDIAGVVAAAERLTGQLMKALAGRARA
jgi:hypothetical protein